MNQTEQEKLYERVLKRWFTWSDRQASGYVHGVVDNLKGLEEPRPIYLQAYWDEFNEYAHGYIIGFVDAGGPETLLTDWATEFQSEITPDHRWWEQCETDDNE